MRGKNIVCAVLMVALLAFPYLAMAEIDISELSFEQLVGLKDQINIAIWNSQEWQEVTVPQGIWEIGVDIPAGYWTIWPETDSWCSLFWGAELNENRTSTKKSIGSAVITSSTNDHFDKLNDINSISWELVEGTFIEVSNGKAVFTPYIGKPSLGFK